MEAIRANEPPGHVSLFVEGEHPPDLPFLVERTHKRIAPAAAASAAWHVTLGVLAILLVRSAPSRGVDAAAIRDQLADKIVWLKEQGPGGGGGGGGNHMKEPPRRAEVQGRDDITAPAAKPASIAVALANAPDPIQQLIIPAKPTAAALDSFPGVIEALPAPPTFSQGPGRAGGAGIGDGTGDGPGDGPGYGPGSRGNTGGRFYQPGSFGVTVPHVLREVKPQYTADAMRAKVQGTVLLACVVRADGTVGEVRVLRSLDPTFGLDQQAIAAAKQLRFAPGTRMGEPVAVQVTIELTFTLR